jgi:hypothetical protein
MDDLVLVQRIGKAGGPNPTRMGRPIRLSFALRNYVSVCQLSLPVAVVNDGDAVDFYLSKAGFAVKIGPEGSRAITGKRSSRTASVPPEIRVHLKRVSEGSHDLIADDRGGNLFFFPFSQFE